MTDLNQIQMGQEFDSQPIYNIKAVVAATGLNAATLRAWERRYGALSPSRTANGYRLYSPRDIATLRWLKARVDEGLSISQAINLMARRQQSQPTHVVESRTDVAHSPAGARTALLRALADLDETEADRVLEEAFAIFGLEAVSEHVVAPVMIMVGDLWHQGKASTVVEHFASSYLRRKLDAIINASSHHIIGQTVVLGCAPNDWHELGILLLHLMLRRKGVNTIYLGQNVPVAQFVEEMTRLRPAMIIIGAATLETAPGLIELARAVEAMPLPKPIFAFGGRVFNAHPHLRDDVPGVFLGESARDGVRFILELLDRHTSLNHQSVGLMTEPLRTD